MDLDFTEEQQMLRAAVRDLLDAHHTTDHLRELEDGDVGFSRDLWAQLAQMDLVGLTIPEQFGGSGMGAIDNALIYAELGRSLATTPHLTSAVFGARALLEAGSDDQKTTWLPRIAKGEVILTAAGYEPDRSEGAVGVAVRAVLDGGDYVVSGTKLRVPLAGEADAILVLVRTGDAPEDLSVLLVPATADGLSMVATEVIGSDREFELTFDNVRVPVADRIGAENSGWATWSEALTDAHIAVAAWAVGGAQQALALTVEYAKERVQFGRAIGSFQGLAHPIADVATALEGAEVLVWRAAWTRDSGRAMGPIAAMAKYAASDIFKQTTKVGQQVFGGVGFTTALDIQLFFRRAKQLELTWGSPAHLEEELAAAELDADEPFVFVDAGIPITQW